MKLYEWNLLLVEAAEATKEIPAPWDSCALTAPAVFPKALYSYKLQARKPGTEW